MSVHRRSLFLGALLLLAASGCDCRGSTDPETAEAVDGERLSDGKPVTFTVDGKGVRYLYRTGYGGARSKLRLDDVPLAYRGAVAVNASGKTDDAAAGQQAYLADLFEAAPGDEATAHLHDQDYFVAASRAGIDAGHLAVATKELAMETAEMSPGSEFREHMTVTMVVEDEKTGRVDKKKVRVKRGSRDKSWEKSVDDTWEGVFGGEADKEAAAEEEDEEPSWRRVIMYTTPWCPACKQAKRWMRQHSVRFEERDVTASPQAREELRSFAIRRGLNPGAVPTLRIGETNRMMQGWHPGRFERLARKGAAGSNE